MSQEAVAAVDEDVLRRLEHLHVRAWPAAETARIDGWLWRWSGGGSQRANSVSTIGYTGLDPALALDAAEARFRSKGVPSQFHTFDLSEPAGLPALLRKRSYGAGETTLTMLTAARAADLPPGVEAADDPLPEWLAVYLSAISENRRTVNREILRRVPRPRAFFQVRHGGRVISTALGVGDGDCVVIECVATLADARGRGGAATAVRAVLHWAFSRGARQIGLQVVETNQAAMAVYARLGFRAVCTNRFWIKQ